MLAVIASEEPVSTLNLIPVRLPNGGLVYVRASADTVPDGAPATRGSSEADVAGHVPQVKDFTQISKTIEGVAQAVKAALDAVKPKKWSAEFGFELEAKTEGVIALFASVDAKADIKVKLEWEG